MRSSANPSWSRISSLISSSLKRPPSSVWYSSRSSVVSGAETPSAGEVCWSLSVACFLSDVCLLDDRIEFGILPPYPTARPLPSLAREPLSTHLSAGQEKEPTIECGLFSYSYLMDNLSTGEG